MGASYYKFSKSMGASHYNFSKSMGAIEAFSKIDGCNCTPITTALLECLESILLGSFMWFIELGWTFCVFRSSRPLPFDLENSHTIELTNEILHEHVSGPYLGIQIDGCKSHNTDQKWPIDGCNWGFLKNRWVQLHPLHPSNHGPATGNPSIEIANEFPTKSNF